MNSVIYEKAPRREYQNWRSDTPDNQTDVRASTDLARWLFCVYNYITLNIVLSSLSVYVLRHQTERFVFIYYREQW